MTSHVQSPIELLGKDKKSDTAYVVGCGPSIDDVDLGLLRGKEVYAMNAAITLFRGHKRAFWFFRDGRAGPEVAPKIDDWKTWRIVTSLVGWRRLVNLANCKRRNCSVYIYSREKVRHKRSIIEDVLQVLAGPCGYRRIVLVGVDHRMRAGRPYAKAFSWKECFWHNPQKPNPDPDLPLRAFIDGLREVVETLPRSCEVINTSDRYPEPIFRHATLEEAVRGSR